MELQLLRYDACQRTVVGQFTGLGAVRPIPGGLLISALFYDLP